MSPALSSSVRIALCGEPEVAPLMRFIHEAWAEGHVLARDEALLRWQYDPGLAANLETSGPTVLVAWAENRIVGMLGLTFMRWLQSGRAYRGAWTSNWVVAPEARRLNVGIDLIHAARAAGGEVLGSLGANSISTRIVRGLGFDVLDEIPRWIGISDTEATARLLAAAGATPDHLVKLDPRAPPGEYEVVPWSPEWSDSWDACWRGSISRTFAGVIRDSSYLRWRYLQHPAFRYHLILARDRSSGRIAGVAVSRIEQVKARAEHILRIVELLPATADAADCLVQELVRTAVDAGVAFADFYCSRPVPALERAGFRLERRGEGALTLPSRFQPLERGGRSINAVILLPNGSRGGLAAMAVRGSLYLTKSDGDQDRPV